MVKGRSPKGSSHPKFCPQAPDAITAPPYAAGGPAARNAELGDRENEPTKVASPPTEHLHLQGPGLTVTNAPAPPHPKFHPPWRTESKEQERSSSPEKNNTVGHEGSNRYICKPEVDVFRIILKPVLPTPQQPGLTLRSGGP